MNTVADKNGTCRACGGTHYGERFVCPYSCATCGNNTEPCEREGCQRNARWQQEKDAAASAPGAGVPQSNPATGSAPK